MKRPIKFEIKKARDYECGGNGYWAVIKAGNGLVLFATGMYERKRDAIKAVKLVINGVGENRYTIKY